MMNPKLARKIAQVSWVLSALCTGFAFLLAVVSQAILDPTPLSRAIESRSPIALLSWTAKCTPLEVLGIGLLLVAGMKLASNRRSSRLTLHVVIVSSLVTVVVVIGIVAAFLAKMASLS